MFPKLLLLTMFIVTTRRKTMKFAIQEITVFSRDHVVVDNLRNNSIVRAL